MRVECSQPRCRRSLIPHGQTTTLVSSSGPCLASSRLAMGATKPISRRRLRCCTRPLSGSALNLRYARSSRRFLIQPMLSCSAAPSMTTTTYADLQAKAFVHGCPGANALIYQMSTSLTCLMSCTVIPPGLSRVRSPTH